jgi:dimethylhistidine N-methyltransferase
MMLDAALAPTDIAGIALQGLETAPKTLPAKLLYDVEGVRLFEAITRLPEYYLTRTERALLLHVAPELGALAAPGSALIEYGASDEGKAALLLDGAPGKFGDYVPIDVAADALQALRARLARTRPHLAVHPICSDFLQPVILPAHLQGARKFGFFPGSTIGNLEPLSAGAFLAEALRTLGPDALFVVGVDLRKSPDVLIPAYDDCAGVTAAFNLNLLHRLNREAAADFDPAAFAHRARWNAAESRIEMHLESLRAQRVRLAGTTLTFEAGETIHTESSYKHSIAGFRALAEAAGWQALKVWTDENNLFSIHALRS